VPGPGGGLPGVQRDSPVVAGPHGARQARVDHLTHGRVGERVLPASVPHQQVAEPRERLPRRGRLAAEQHRQRLRRDGFT